MSNMNLILGDCLVELPKLEPDSVDSLVTDPPYGLSFMNKDWDHGIPGAHFWKEALRVAKPGAYLVALGGTRTYHRLACAIEDAGWEVRDCLMWLYGSGFPKSLDVSKAIDKSAGAERPVIGTWRPRGTARPKADGRGGYRGKTAGIGSHADAFNGELSITGPATDAAKQWEGWGTALKPAWESIILAQKPLPESAERRIIVESLIHLEAQLWSLLSAKVAERDFGLSRQEHKEVCAFAHWPVGERSNTRDVLSGLMGTSRFVPVLSSCLSIVSSWRGILAESYGRSNTSTTRTATSPITDFATLQSSVLALTPLTIIQAAIQQPGSWWLVLPAARALNAVVASTANTLMPSVQEPATSKVAGKVLLPNWEPIILARKPLIGTVAANVLEYGTGGINIDATRIGTCGGTKRDGQAPYLLKPNGKEDRSVGRARTGHGVVELPKGRWPANVMLDEAAARVLDAQTGILKSGDWCGQPTGGTRMSGNKIYGKKRSLPYFYKGDSGGASRFFYCAKASRRERGAGNNHPTVKPLDLMCYLCRLVTPKGGHVLDPFMGSGSTGVACQREGFDFTGIELTVEYLQIAKQRMLPKK